MNRWLVAALSAASTVLALSLVAANKDEARERERERVLREAFRKR